MRSLIITFVLILLCVIAESLTQIERPAARKCSQTVVVVLCRADKKTLNKINTSKCPSRTNDLKHAFERQIIQTIALCKSIMLTSRWRAGCSDCLNMLVVASAQEDFQELEKAIVAEKWDIQFSRILNISFVEARYPAEYAWMKSAYRTCSTLKLFLPELLPDHDAVIYVDTDFLFFRHWSNLWLEFSKFDLQTVAGLVPEWYNTKFLKESYNPAAYNTGLMLMNLTRMRDTKWSHKIGIFASLYLKESSFGDQDILVRYFLQFPQELFDLPCHWNFAPRNRRFGSECAGKTGISALHGFRRQFFANSYFNAIYKPVLAANLTSDLSVHTFTSTIENVLKIEQAYRHRLGTTVVGDYAFFNDLISKAMLELNQDCVNQNIESTTFPNYQNSPDQLEDTRKHLYIPDKAGHSSSCRVTFAITLCENQFRQNVQHQLEQALTLIKSIIITHIQRGNLDSGNCTTLVVVTNRMQSYTKLNREFLAWNAKYRKFIHLIPVVYKYPKGYKRLTNLFKPCATFRLFYPDILPDYPAVIHVDTDFLLIDWLEELWKYFDEFSSKTLLAAAPQLGIKTNIEKILKQPTNYQAGIMLMNLTQMRSTEWTSKIGMILTLLGKNFFLPVQSTLEIYNQHFPGEFQHIPCHWNYLPHYCELNGEPGDKSNCQHSSGLSGLHGVNVSFHEETMEPVFQTIFRVYSSIDLRRPDFTMREFVSKIEASLDNVLQLNVHSPCSNNQFRTMLLKKLNV